MSLPLRFGDLVASVPNHACATCNMHDELYAVEPGQVGAVWPVAGRGQFR
jgi:D-serine deaminase-like pyridoxal phosphate-dependent protein